MKIKTISLSLLLTFCVSTQAGTGLEKLETVIKAAFNRLSSIIFPRYQWHSCEVDFSGLPASSIPRFIELCSGKKDFVEGIKKIKESGRTLHVYVYKQGIQKEIAPGDYRTLHPDTTIRFVILADEKRTKNS